MKKIAITSVYANPLHPGHIECFELSRALADELIVIVNNDHQAKLKRGTESFQDEQYRLKLVESIKPVSRAVLSIDDDPTVCKTLSKVIEEIHVTYGDECEIIFTKGGDRFAHEIPERVVCDQFGVRIVDGLGAKTHNSSSYIARVANKADTEQLSAELANIPNEHKEKEYIEVGMRPWGVYYVLEDQPNFKIKKIIVSPKNRLSLQSHEKRSEHWVVVSGTAHVQIREKDHPDHIGHRVVNANESCFVPQGHIHRLSNEHDDHLVVIEVQCGDYTGEDDITRYEDDFNRA